MNELAQLEADEQAALRAMRAAQERKRALLAAIADEQVKAQQAQHEALQKRVAQLMPVTVLGVSYPQLRKQVIRTGVRFVPVHQDIRALLIAALPCSSEEQFCELCSALTVRLMLHSMQVRSTIDSLREDAATQHYFDPELRNSVTVVTCEGRLSSIKHAMLSDMLTAWALAWGEATGFEEKENE